MKILSFFAATFLICTFSKAQTVICDTMPIAYDYNTMEFTSSPASTFGDSVLYIDLTNNTTTNFGYPLAKIVPASTLPAGMTIAQHSLAWQPFASSWNTGQTAEASFFFDVAQPIPQDFMFTFNLYLSNFSPLAVDSCVFSNMITIIINPSLSLNPASEKQLPYFTLLPNPAVNELTVKFNHTAGKLHELELYDLSGKLVRTWSTGHSELYINTSRIESGIYYLVSDKTLQRQKLVIAH